MRVPLAWLRDYIDLVASTDEIAERLALLGFPVENVERRRPLAGVVSGKIVKLAKHPNADRLQVCTIDTGGTTMLTIVTAATNVAAGQVVPVATIGARLWESEIAPRAMRGIASEGMLCSANELGLDEAWFEDGILQLDASTPLGTDVVQLFRLSDDVLEIEVTANRVDAMSIAGIARELGAAYGLAVREPAAHEPQAAARDQASPGIRVTLESADCRRYIAQRFSGVRVEGSPAWMRIRLALAGQRPISSVVDVSNFVMLETAQPLHFFDYEKLTGHHIVVRDARPGERLRTLDGEERTLDERSLVIADERDAQGLAGLKGGAASEVTAATREIVMESATFSGPRVRRMSVALGLRTDASGRHEKGLALGLADMAAARASALLQQFGATPHEPVIAGGDVAQPAAIDVTPAQIRQLLGIDVPRAEVERALRALGFTVSGEFSVTPPYWRADVAIVADVIEEIARVVGYDRIASEEPPVLAHAISSQAYLEENRIADALVRVGYREAITLALQPAAVHERFARAGVELARETLEITNPLSEDQRFLRFSLIPALLGLARRHQGDGALRLFEIGRVFEGAEASEFEIPMAAWMLSVAGRDEPGWRDEGFLAFKADSLAFIRDICGRDADSVTGHAQALHPGKAATLLVDGKDAATIGAVDPRLLAAYDIERAVYIGLLRIADAPSWRAPRYSAPSRYPGVARDLALVVAAELPAKDIEHAIRASAGDSLREVTVFDEYRGPQIEDGKKSLAVRIVLQKHDATLTDAEVEADVARIVAALRERAGAKIRE